MYYYNVIPLVKTSLLKSPSFTYKNEQKIPLGSLVKINFSNRILNAIVEQETKKPFFATKFIIKTVTENFLTLKQLKFAENISQKYFTSLGVVLKFMVIPLTQKIEPFSPPFKCQTEKSVVLTNAQKQASKKILSEKNFFKFLLCGPASCGKTEVIIELVKNNLLEKKQSLILVPEIFLSYQEIHRYNQRLSQYLALEKEAVVFVHSGLKPSELSYAWKKIKDGSAKIIISTRTGIFFPFKDLGLIVVDEEQDISHKQWDQSPRYHIRDLAAILGHIHKTKVIYASATPSLESLANSSEVLSVFLPMLKTKDLQVKPPSIQIIDLKKYYFKNKNRPIILSDELKTALNKTLKNNEIAFILVSRQGKSKTVICHDCKTLLKCPNCQTPLINSSEQYICLHCSYKKSSFASCPTCGSYRLKSLGFGTEKAAQDLKNLFPSARIDLADAKVFKQEGYRINLYEKLCQREIDVLVGSQTIIKGFDIKDVSLVAILNADDWSGQTDFRFDERFLGNLFQLSGRVNRPHSLQDGQVIIQTYHPENPLYEFLKQWDWLAFAKQEQQNRQQLLYPPACQLIRLIFRHTDPKIVDKQIKLVYNKLIKMTRAEETQGQDKKNILQVSEPYEGFIKKQRQKWQKNILIKVVSLDNPPLRTILNSAAKDFIIDINPETIF